MKPTINNPASGNNMWVSKMPNNFQAAKRETNGVVPNSIYHHQVNQTHKPTSRLTKGVLMKYYTDQIHPQYPFLTKTKVRAALELADNNLHECRLILDFKAKLIQVKKPLKLVPECLSMEKSANEGDLASLNSFVAAGTKSFESNHIEKTDEKVSSNVSSSVYDFSDTDTDITSSSEWFEERRANELPIPSRKIGVLIMKCDTGYKALPL